MFPRLPTSLLISADLALLEQILYNMQVFTGWMHLQGYHQRPQQCFPISSTYWVLDNMQLSRTFQMNFHFAEFMQVRNVINLTAAVIRICGTWFPSWVWSFISLDIGNVRLNVPFIINPLLSLLDKLNKI